MKFIDTLHGSGWRTVGGEDGPAPHPLPSEGQLLTLEQWHAVRDTWPQGLRTAVQLSNTVNVAGLVSDLPRLALVVLHFPKWTDGRAYSQAHLLRIRHQFKGAIRAREGDLGVIPGSMGAASYIVRGLGNPASYNSCSHGAGRRMSRGQARRSLDPQAFKDAMGGTTWQSNMADALIFGMPRQGRVLP